MITSRTSSDGAACGVGVGWGWGVTVDMGDSPLRRGQGCRETGAMTAAANATALGQLLWPGLQTRPQHRGWAGVAQPLHEDIDSNLRAKRGAPARERPPAGRSWFSARRAAWEGQGERLLRLGEVGQALAPQRLPQLEQAAGLDLADALAGDAVGPGHLLQRPRVAVAQP